MFVPLTFMLIVGFMSHGSEGVNSTCKSFPVIEGDGTNITCYFDKDVSKLQRDIKLYHDSYTVLTVSWKDGLPEIHSKSGYQFQGGITSKLTVTIPRAQMENGGTYSCHVVLSKASAAKPCSLKVSDRCAANLNTSSSENNSTGCTKNLREVECSNVPLWVGFVIACALLIISVCFNACFIVQRAKSTRQENQSDKRHPEQNETLFSRTDHSEPDKLATANMDDDEEEEPEYEAKNSTKTPKVNEPCQGDSDYYSERDS